MTYAQVYRCALWMMHHGGPSPKRTWLWSNMREIYQLDLGTLTKHERESKTTSKTVQKYTNSKGKKCFHGLPALSSSQILATYLKRFAL